MGIWLIRVSPSIAQVILGPATFCQSTPRDLMPLPERRNPPGVASGLWHYLAWLAQLKWLTLPQCVRHEYSTVQYGAICLNEYVATE